MSRRTKLVYNARGVEFTIYETPKSTKSGPKRYWVLVDYSTGKLPDFNSISRREPIQCRKPQIPFTTGFNSLIVLV